ncbi:MAG: M1 family aminopeptidase [Blastocatellia bacterium]|nr:M1 family aminopeptidase [Blastocatellia bacterium]
MLSPVLVLCLLGWRYEARAAGEARSRYRIELALDYREATYSGWEVVRFVNTTREEMDELFFNLFPNLGLAEDENAWLTINRVTTGARELRFGMRSRSAVIKVELGRKLLPGQSIEVKVEFNGKVPRIQREESSLLAHFLQEVNDAVSDERQMKDARDIFFAADEAMLLGYFYPVATARPMQSAEQGLAVGVGALACGDASDYEVFLTTDAGVTVIGSGAQSDAARPSESGRKGRLVHAFRGENLRGFGLALAERVNSVQQMIGRTRVASYSREGDERLGQRALKFAAEAIRSYEAAFGEFPHPQFQVIEMPLPAGYSGIEFPGLFVLAQAYYIDFDAPQSVRLPGVLREQADVIKSSFEFTLAYGVARQWWGSAVGNDSERTPYLDEALATWSAAYYHEAAYGKDLGNLVLDQQLKGVYQVYRMLGGPDMEVDRPLRDFRNPLQYTAIVQAKGALLFAALRRELGDTKFFGALRQYFAKFRYQQPTVENMRILFSMEAEDPRVVRGLFQRWLKEKRGDEDIGASDLGQAPPPVSKIRALGRVFVKIGKTAAKPF